MQVQCPSCGKTLKAPDHLAGRVVKCPGCGGQMQLPELEAAAPAPPAGRGASGGRARPGGISSRSGLGKPGARTAPGGGKTKKCRFCGEQILAAATKCRHCKSNLAGGAAKTVQRFHKREASASGNKALILGLLSFVCVFGFIMAPLAIVYGNSARKAGDGKGTAGMVLGIVSSVLWFLGIIGGVLSAL